MTDNHLTSEQAAKLADLIIECGQEARNALVLSQYKVHQPSAKRHVEDAERYMRLIEDLTAVLDGALSKAEPKVELKSALSPSQTRDMTISQMRDMGMGWGEIREHAQAHGRIKETDQ